MRRPAPPGDLKPAEIEKQGKSPADTHEHTHAQLFVSKERSEHGERKRAEECRRKIHSSQGEKLLLLKDDYLEDGCALFGGKGKNF